MDPSSLNLIDIKKMLDYFKLNGKFNKTDIYIKPRKAQLQMIKGVANAFNENKIYLCEAPTGTGKSLAYLLPTFEWVINNPKEIVVISTNTINLQEQLIKKDITFLKEVFADKEIKITLVKGKNNYLCFKKSLNVKSKTENETQVMGSSFFEPRNNDKEKLIEWAKNTETGDKNELDFVPSYDLWEEFACEDDTCKTKRCVNPSICYYSKARKEVFSSNILIVNHHLLCADLSIKAKIKDVRNNGKEDLDNISALLPSFDRLIIDEAHNLEEVATTHFASNFSIIGITRNLNLLGVLNPKYNRNPEKEMPLKDGIILKIYKYLKIIPLKESEDNLKIQQLFGIFTNLRIKCNQAIRDFAEKIEIYLQNNEEKRLLKNHAYTKRITDKDIESKNRKENYTFPIKKLIKLLEEIVFINSQIKNILSKYLDYYKKDKQFESLFSDFVAYTVRIEKHLIVLNDAIASFNSEKIVWILFKKDKRSSITITISPLYSSKYIKEYCLNIVKTIILSSATLSVGSKSLDFYRNSIGLDNSLNHRIIESTLESDFNYEKNCLLFVPNELPSVTAISFMTKAIEYIINIVKLLQGKTLILCTSYEQLKIIKANKVLNKVLKEEKITLLIQGDIPNYSLIKAMKSNKKALLVGVNSFWEGIDIQGENLSCVIIVKLPFPAPNIPIIEARLEALTLKGENAFNQYLVPSANIKFKQGFGRLIRSNQDKGLFVVLDKRIIDKYYGKTFLNSLPNVKRMKGNNFKEAFETIF